MQIDTDRLTRAQVAEVIGMSDGWVRDRMQAGDMPRPGQPASVYVQALVAYRTAPVRTDRTTLEEERTRLAAAQAEAQERRNAREAGDLMPKREVVELGQGFVAACRARLLAIPARAAPIVTPLRSAATVEAKLRDFIHEALSELARLQTIGTDAHG